MYSRKYSLKTRYNFNKVLKFGKTFHTESLIIKFLKVAPEVFLEDDADKKFGIIVSSRFSKKAVTQNKVRRTIAEAIRREIERFPSFHYYVFVPKKRIPGSAQKGVTAGAYHFASQKVKIDIDAEKIGLELDSFLSKMAVV